MAAARDTDTPLDRNPKLTVAEIGGALTEDELDHAERLTLRLLGEIRREKQESRQ